MPLAARLRSPRARRALAAALALALVALASAAPGTPRAGAQAPACRAVPDAGFARAWAASRGWTGGDGAVSVALPGGRSAWLFGDTFLGGLRRNGTRDPSRSRFLRNTFVVRSRSGRLRTYFGGSRRAPRSFVSVRGRPSHWYWPQSGIVEGGRLKVVLVEYRRTGRSIFSHAPLSSAVATFSLPRLRLLRLRRVAGRSRDYWGAALLPRADGFTYVFGVERGRNRSLELARARRGHLDSRWQFWTGRGWSGNRRRAAKALAGLSTQFSVLERPGGGLALVVQRFALSRDVYVHRAPDVTGPWSAPARIFTTPEGKPRFFTYNMLAHPEYDGAGGLLFSYNVNATTVGGLFGDAQNFRPRFVRMPLSCLDV
jgi:uncharacterized protein DUF4185